MNTLFKRNTLGIKTNEVISVGKCWLWMTIFSTCLFTSCGETNRQSSEPAVPEPQAQAIPARYDREMIRTQEVDLEDEDSLDSAQLEEFSDSDFDEPDLERFEDDDEIPSEVLQEVR